MEQVRKLIFTRKPGLEENDIINTEKLLGAKFPNKFRELVKLINHAEIDEWILYPIKDNKRIAKTFDDIIRNNKELDFRNMKERFIFIGEDVTGDLIGYKINNEGNMEETVYYLNHESQEVTLLFNDIEEMIKKSIKE
jgi:hypothetical protein